MKLRLNDRILARDLRSQGLSFNEIREHIPNLSKGTLNGWLKDIKLSEKQIARLLEKIKTGAERGRLKGAFSNRQKRLEITTRIIDSAKSDIRGDIVNPMFISGVMLYWAEGDKTNERVGFTNADPQMICYIMRWFREICTVPETKFRIALSIMTLHNKDEAEKYWSDITGVPKERFNKTRIKPTLLKGKRNASYMGTCRIIISDKNLFRKIMGWKLGILEVYNLV